MRILVVMGPEVVDQVAGTKTSPEDRPPTDISITKAKLIKRTRVSQ